MIIISEKNENTLKIALDGRLDTISAPQLEKELAEVMPGATELIFDFEKLKYISSSGLRVLLSVQQTMNKQGNMCIENVSETVREVFDLTGFTDFLTIK